MGTLVLTWAAEDAHHGKLTARLASEDFAGVGAAWFSREALDLFVERLLAYPLDPNALPLLIGVTEQQFRLRLVPHDVRGTVRVDARLTGDRPELSFVVEGAILVRYNDVERFAGELRAALEAEQGDARLTADLR